MPRRPRRFEQPAADVVREADEGAVFVLAKNLLENAIGADNTLGGMVKDCVLTDTVITHSFDGDAPIGSARMQFRVQYRTSETDAGSVIS